MVQTEDIGFEKIVCNVGANPNIRYIIVGGPEPEGHLIGEALKALLLNGVDDKGKPFLKTVTLEKLGNVRRPSIDINSILLTLLIQY